MRRALNKVFYGSSISMRDITSALKEKWGKPYAIGLLTKDKKMYIAVYSNVRADMAYIDELMNITKQLNDWGLGNNLIHMIKTHENTIGPEINEIVAQKAIQIPLGVTADDAEWII